MKQTDEHRLPHSVYKRDCLAREDSKKARDQVVLVQTDRLEAVFGVELNDTLKKPTSRSNGLRKGFGQSRATGNLRLFTLWGRVSSYQVFF